MNHEPSRKQLFHFLYGRDVGVGTQVRVGGLDSARQVGDCRRSLPTVPQDLRGKDYDGGGGRKTNNFFSRQWRSGLCLIRPWLWWRPESSRGLTSSRGNWELSFVKSIH
jgi:hypothetical protein